MVWIIFLIFYIPGYLFCFRRIAGQIAWHQSKNSFYGSSRGDFPTGNQWFGGCFAALFASVVWPLSLVVAYGISGSREAKGFFYIPQDRKEEILERKIKELERAAGMR